MSRKLVPYVFVAPFYLVFGAFWLGPILFSLWMSLTEWDGMSPPAYVGVTNYVRLRSDPLFWQALCNTLAFVLVYTTLLMVLAFLLALTINAVPRRLGMICSTIYFAPVTMSLIVVALVFSLIFGRDYGLLNSLLRLLRLPANYGWLENADTAMWAIVVLRLWRALGYYATIFLAGLQNIPKEILEASAIDGAGPVRRVTHVILPMLRPVLAFALIMALTVSFQLFDEPWILTGGGPNNATLTLVIYLYQNSFSFFRLGYGAAISYVLTFLTFVASLTCMKVLGGNA